MFALLPVESVIGPVLQTSPLLFERAHGSMWKTWVAIPLGGYQLNKSTQVLSDR